MPITVHCDSCRRELRVPDELLGKLVKCPSCGHTFTAIEQDAVVEAVAGPEPVQAFDEPPRPQRRAEPRAEDDDDYEHRPRSDQKPGKVQAIGIMMLVGGIMAIITGGGWLMTGVFSGGMCCLWPGGYYSLVLGIMATMKGSQLLGATASMQAPPKGIAIMQIINIVNGDIPNCVMGILALVFLNEPETNRYFRGR